MDTVMRKLQPAHRSKNITLAQARKAWIKVEAEERAARRLRRAARRTEERRAGGAAER